MHQPLWKLVRREVYVKAIAPNILITHSRQFSPQEVEQSKSSTALDDDITPVDAENADSESNVEPIALPEAKSSWKRPVLLTTAVSAVCVLGALNWDRIKGAYPHVRSSAYKGTKSVLRAIKTVKNRVRAS